jgi:ribose/xylose/arabinose/galactoside ABC-type transport system permease subunit
MPDGLIATVPHEPPDARPERTARPVWVGLLADGLSVVAVFAGAGALCGLLWFRLWEPPRGVVSGHEWYTSESGLRADFEGTGWYVAIAAAAGLLLGVLAAWLCRRSELVTLAAVVGGSVLAAYLMLQVGYHQSPPDPDVLARAAEDGTRLDGALRVDSWPPRAAFPFGALLGLALVYASTLGRTPPGEPSRQG